MTRGLLIHDSGQVEETLVFTCPGCSKEHSILVCEGKTYEKDVGKGFTVNVWSYKKGENNILEISPSFDASDYCGYHGPGVWQVEVKFLGDKMIRNKQTEDWLQG